MKLLAFNTVIPGLLRLKYQILIWAAPSLLMFATFLPIIQFAYWLDSPAGASFNPAATGSPYLVAWGILAAIATIAAMLVGHAVGWLLNVVVSLTLLRWPTEKVRALYLRSEPPNHWFKDGVGSSGEANSRAIEEWEKHRIHGPLRFIAVRGVLAWGGPMFVAMYVIPTASKGVNVALTSIFFNIGIWLVAGVFFGAGTWWWSQANYEKLRGKSSD